MIRKMLKSDIPNCAEILCAVYNNEMWRCRWTLETGIAYLEDYFETKKFTIFLKLYGEFLLKIKI